MKAVYAVVTFAPDWAFIAGCDTLEDAKEYIRNEVIAGAADENGPRIQDYIGIIKLEGLWASYELERLKTDFASE